MQRLGLEPWSLGGEHMAAARKGIGLGGDPSFCLSGSTHQTIRHVGRWGGRSGRKASRVRGSGAKRIQSMAAVSMGSRSPTRPRSRVDRRPACVRTRLTVAALRFAERTVLGDRDRLAWKFDCFERELYVWRAGLARWPSVCTRRVQLTTP